MGNSPKEIAEFARNEMVRADHTISWAGDVVAATLSASFKVVSNGQSFIVCVIGEADNVQLST